MLTATAEKLNVLALITETLVELDQADEAATDSALDELMADIETELAFGELAA